MKRTFTALLTAVTATIAFTACGSPDGGGATSEPETNYPTEPITFVVPYPAGSAADGSARVIAQQLEEDLDVSIVIENREGGASTIGLYELASSEPDGYTIGLGTFSGMLLQSRIIENPFEGLESLTPIAQTKLPAPLLFASPDKGWDSIDAFVEDAKANPGEITVGIPNPGSAPDVIISLLEEAADIELEKVYYDAGQQVLPVVNGTTDLGIGQAGPILQFVEVDELMIVGVFGSNAPEGIDAPLFEEEGYDTSRFIDSEGVFGPAGLPEDIVTRLSDAIGDAVASDEFQELMGSTYNTPSFLPAEEYADLAVEQNEQTEQLVEDLGLAQ